MLNALLKNYMKKWKRLKIYILKKYTNPEIRFEGYRYLSSQKEVVLRYYKDWYEIVN